MSKVCRTILLSAVIALSTAGCDAIKQGIEASQQAVENLNQAAENLNVGSKDDQILEAMNSYASASNRLSHSRDSFPEMLAKYKKQDFANSTKDIKKVDTFFDPDRLKWGIEELEKARKFTLGAPYDKLEAAADNLLAALRPFYKTADALEKYRKSKEYIEDKGAFAKSQDEQFIKEAEAFVAAALEFEAAHDAASLIHDEAYIKQLRARGETRRALVHEATLSFKKLLNLFDDKGDLKDPDKQAQADALIDAAKVSIETLLAENEKYTGDKDRDHSKIVGATEKLNSLLGDAREFKASKYSAKKYDSLIESYNRYIQFTLNMM